MESPETSAIQMICNSWQIRDFIVSSTGEISFDVKEIKVAGNKIEFDHETPIPVQNAYHTPHTLGEDRIVGVVAAWDLFPDQTTCVIDVGTCITIDVVESTGTYIGGNISPGWKMRFRAMDEFTHALPLVQGDSDPEIMFGRSTEEALNLGGTVGVIFEIEGYLRALKDKYGQINIILTGGDAIFFDQHIKSEIFVHPDLILQGLDGILRYQNYDYE